MEKSNYENAKEEADKIDDKIIKALESGKSFRVEAGAGSGKTYSLNKVIDWIQKNKNDDLIAKKQKIACITYTNAAVNVILERLSSDSSVTPSTIHSFAWENMCRFQSSLIKIAEELSLLPEEYSILDINAVSYTLGVRYIENGILYLYHDDVIKMFVKLLENTKFRRFLSFNFPIILIDEYQDSFKSIIDQFIALFIASGTGPQFGFFGDSWQTIYGSNGACGLVEHDNIQIINKKSNFRSQQVIVDLLNKVRPELEQITATDQNDGTAIVITTNDYKGLRQSGYYKDELPEDLLKEYIEKIQKKVLNKYSDWEDSSKVLMITHKMLAKQQGYEKLLQILDDSLKNEEDIYVDFLKNRIEPVYQSLIEGDTKKLFDYLGIKQYPILQKKQKKMWAEFKVKISLARNKTIGEVIKCAIDSKIIPIPPKVLHYNNLYLEDPSTAYSKGTLSELYNIEYSEILNVIGFLNEEATYSTEHGVKGEEYDNVLFVVGRGWNNYRFDKCIYKNQALLNGREYDEYIRNRNLFYVCCSRPKKRLVMFVTVPVEGEFEIYLKKIFGASNIFTYSQFVND